jgi:hypothetical protein
MLGAHRIIWMVEAGGRDAALALLPPYLVARTDVDPIREVTVP